MVKPQTKPMVYTDAQRAIAIEAVQRNGGVLDATTLDVIRVAIDAPKLSKQLVYNWLKTWSVKPESNVQSNSLLTLKKEPALPRAEIQSKAAEKLDEMLEAAARKFVGRAVEEKVINDADLRGLMTAAGIAIDKMQLLRGLPTEIVRLLPQLIAVADARGANIVDILRATIAELGEARNADGN